MLPIRQIEDCPTPLVIVATNLSLQREEIFTDGPLIDAIRASGSVPMLFKPVEIGGDLFVDGGVVNKAPVQALAELIRPEKILVHFIASDNLESPENSFLKKTMTPWHIHHLSVNISRQEAYESQCDRVRQRGIGLIEVRTHAPAVGPKSLEKGPLAYHKAREATLKMLSKEGF